ncbi:MAG: RidA family protein [Nitrospinota bacterium]
MARKIRQQIFPKEFPEPRMSYSPGIKAGPWIFVAGQIASEYSERGMHPNATRDPLTPYLQPAEVRLQAFYSLPNLEKVLTTGGSSFDRTVRIDQFMVLEDTPDGEPNEVSEYIRTRNELIPEPTGMPASTAVGCSHLLCKPCIVEVDFLALTGEADWKKEVINSSRVPRLPWGDNHAVRAGPYVFCSGQLAANGSEGSAPSAPASPTAWYGNDMERQTQFILDRLSTVLEDAGSSLDLTVKAQVYLTAQGMKQIWKLDDVWKEYFPKNPPARTITPAEGLALKECLVEINLVALTKDSGIKPETVKARGVPKWPLHEPHAVKAGNLLFLSTGIASDDKGRVPKDVQVNPFFPWYEKGIRKQTDYILSNAEKIVKAAGGSGFDNIMRRQCFHSDYDEFILSWEVWEKKFPHAPPASTTIEVSGVPLPVPGATLALDIWAYIP